MEDEDALTPDPKEIGEDVPFLRPPPTIITTVQSLQRIVSLLDLWLMLPSKMECK